MTIKSFDSELELMKHVVRDEVEHFLAMLDCTDNPPCLDYSVEKYGVNVRFSVSIDSGPDAPAPNGPIEEEL